MKFLKLRLPAYIAGLLRMPHEGVIHVEDAEAQHVLANDSAEDVSADFTVVDDVVVPVQSISTETGADEAAALTTPEEHQEATQDLALPPVAAPTEPAAVDSPSAEAEPTMAVVGEDPAPAA